MCMKLDLYIDTHKTNTLGNKICNLYENNTYFILLFEVFISK